MNNLLVCRVCWLFDQVCPLLQTTKIPPHWDLIPSTPSRVGFVFAEIVWIFCSLSAQNNIRSVQPKTYRNVPLPQVHETPWSILHVVTKWQHSAMGPTHKAYHIPILLDHYLPVVARNRITFAWPCPTPRGGGPLGELALPPGASGMEAGMPLWLTPPGGHSSHCSVDILAHDALIWATGEYALWTTCTHIDSCFTPLLILI